MKPLNSRQQKLLSEILPKSRHKNSITSADNMIEKNIFILPPFAPKIYEEGIIWGDSTASRSYLRLLHGHSFLGCLNEAYLKTKDRKYIVYAVDQISDWYNKYSDYKINSDMSYHDETTALRLTYWLALYINTYEVLSELQFLDQFEKMLKETAILLSNETFYSKNTNHGMFQDIALFAYSVCFEDETISLQDSFKSVAINRLLDYFKFVYTKDGVHKEQSPSYHMLVSKRLKNISEWIAELDPSTSKFFKEIYQTTLNYSTHIIKPDGKYPQIGDTSATSILEEGHETLYDDASYLYAVSAGQRGSVPLDTDVVFEDMGYAIFRDSWTLKEQSTYVLFSAAYKSNYHKHSDDLSVLIYSNGDIITEAGPNGYNYSDPYTQYAYSSWAHNSLVVNGKGLPRTDNQFDKVYIADYKVGEICSDVTGVNKRYENVTHTRKLIYDKQSKSVHIEDNICSENENNYKLLWHIASDIQVIAHDRIIELFRNETKVMEIEINSESPFTTTIVNGQNQPNVLGWEFPKMEQANALSTLIVEVQENSTTFNTTFRLDNFKMPTTLNDFSKNQCVFKSHRDITYLFQGATDPNLNDKLLIVFSSMAEKSKFVYNYVNTLAPIPCNKLFILDDFGDQGSYYIGQNQDLSIESSVSSLIDYIKSKYNIHARNVIVAGSSKGGYAALYFGLKKFLGNIIVGGPQVFLGDFLLNNGKHDKVAKYISGGTLEANKYYLNQILFKLLNRPKDISIKIDIIVGDKDYHYKTHVQPLIAKLEDENQHHHLQVVAGKDHGDLGEIFSKFLVEKSVYYLGCGTPIVINSLDYSYDQRLKKLNLNCDVDGESLQYAYYVYKDKEVVEKTLYSSSETFEYAVSDKGVYQIRVYIKNSNFKVAKNTDSILVKEEI